MGSVLYAQVEKILLDYDENSIVTTYDQTFKEKMVYKGVEVKTKALQGKAAPMHATCLYAYRESTIFNTTQCCLGFMECVGKWCG